MSGILQPAFVAMGAAVFSSNFQIRGKLHTLGILSTFINDDQKPTLTFFEAEALGVEASNATRMTHPEIIVNKRTAQMIAFEVMPAAGSLALPPRAEALVVYTDRYAIAAKYYMGMDARLSDFADASLQQFLIAVDAKMYPLFPARPGLVNAAPLIMLQKAAIRFYHKG